jgi:DNA-3-methyladenine glycosylase
MNHPMHVPGDPLQRDWFARDAAAVAQALIGCQLVRTLDDGTILAGIINETEAYIGPEDQASHAFNGHRSARNESMWLKPATSYVYFTYGMHYCFNVSCLSADHPAAVLIRSIVPICGKPTMRHNRTRTPRKHSLKDQDLCNGPAKLCQALAIGPNHDALDLLHSPQLAIRQGFAIPQAEIQTSPRIGIPNAGVWKDKPLRWFARVDPFKLGCEKMQ